ncbi:S8 family serine peptidase [Micromonospora sp. NPDC003197]
MTTKVRAWPSLVGSVALVIVLTHPTGAEQTAGAASPAAVPVAVSAAPAHPMTGTATQRNTYVKYYIVSAGPDGVESLAAIAGRLLDSAGRAEEIYRLNRGRRQADGHTLTDSRQLHAGWTLILPWDAVGDGVRVGPMPPDQDDQQPSGGSPLPSPAPGNRPPTSPRCVSSVPTQPGSGWAQERMAADQAWGRTRGAGVLVAVVDSGVDASLPELRGRVAVGADIPSGSGRGDVDCFGSGTAMASIIGARPSDITAQAGSAAALSAPVTGMAPEATILPLRIVGDTPRSTPADTATAIEVAVSAGARVLALGAFVDVSDTTVAETIRRACEHNVVVVASAPTGTDAAPSADPGGWPAALLRVGGVGPEGQPAADYRPSGVDVTAPGIDVASLGAGGSGARANSGSQYAVAFAAGTAALVRSAFPNLDATQVVHRIKTTAGSGAHSDADPATGWGMINPGVAVVATLTEEASPATDDDNRSQPLRILTVALLVVVGIAAFVLLARRPAADDGDVPAGAAVDGDVPAGAAGTSEPGPAGARE